MPSSLRRMVAYALTVFVLITLNFLVPRLMPGDPLAGLQDQTSPAYVRDDPARAGLAAYYGLDRPLVSQYLRYLEGLVRGDLGISTRYHAPVSDVIIERLPWTLLLMATALALATTAGLLGGIHSGWHRGRAVDRGMLTTFVGLSNAPTYFLATLALLVFAVTLRWVPLGGATMPFSALDPLARVVDIIRHLILPASVLALQSAAFLFLVMRAGMVTELGSAHLMLGRAKGLPESWLKYRYAARNALLPVVTILALQVGFAAAGDVFVERIFAYPGMGRLIFDSVAARDYPVLQGCFLVMTMMVVTANLVADLAYARLDPRSAA